MRRLPMSKRCDIMDKRVKIDEFLDYGGNELFSTLMNRDIERSGGIDRLIHLLKSYSDSCGRIKGRSAAYRFMLRKALRNGWIGRGFKDLKSHRLTREEREYIEKNLDEYISSGGRNMRVMRKVLSIAAIIIIVGLLVFAMVRYLMSDEYHEMLSKLSLVCNVLKL